MYNINYKKLKYDINISFLNNLLKEAYFISFVQIKSFDSYDFAELKKYLISMKLNIFVSKKTELHKKMNLLNSIKKSPNKLIKGNIAIIYSMDPNFITYKEAFLFLDFVNKSSNVIPLYFYVLKRFLTINKLVKLIQTSSQEKYCSLLSILVLNNCNILKILENKKQI